MREYLESREQEVLTIMLSIFSQEGAMEMYGNRREREGKIKVLHDMIMNGTITVSQAAKELNMTVEQFREAVDALMLPQNA